MLILLRLFFIMIGIYKITSPSGRIYIGQSTNIVLRFNMYKLMHCKNQKILYKSLKKYGYDNHVFEIIEICDVEHLNDRERHWQDFYNVLDGGLNCKLTQCTDRMGKHSEETKIKISKSNSGKSKSNLHKENLRKAKMGHKNPNFGIKRSVNTINKIRNSNLGQKRSLETCMNISKSKKGTKLSEETKIKIGLASKGNKYALGHKKTESQKKHMSIKMTGKKHSLESRALMSESQKGNTNGNKILLDLNTGFFYDSVIDYSQYYKYKVATIRKKLQGKTPLNIPVRYV